MLGRENRGEVCREMAPERETHERMWDDEQKEGRPRGMGRKGRRRRSRILHGSKSKKAGEGMRKNGSRKVDPSRNVGRRVKRR